MDANDREWSHERERRERESFVVLQHVYTISGGSPSAKLPRARLCEDLGHSEPGFTELVDHLVAVGYLALIGGGSQVSVTSGGVEYIERHAWRRRSVRAPSLPPPPLPDS